MKAAVVTPVCALLVVYTATFAFAQAKIPSEAILFRNVKVFDGEQNGLQDLDVLVVGNKIHKIASEIPEAGAYEVDVTTQQSKPVAGLGGLGGYTFQFVDDQGRTETKKVEVTSNFDARAHRKPRASELSAHGGGL